MVTLFFSIVVYWIRFHFHSFCFWSMPVCGPPYRAWGAVDPPWKFTFFLDFNPTITPFFLYRCRSVDPLSGKGGRGPPWNFFFFPSIPIRRLLVFLYRCRSVEPLTGHGGAVDPLSGKGAVDPQWISFFPSISIRRLIIFCIDVGLWTPLQDMGGRGPPTLFRFVFSEYYSAFKGTAILLYVTELTWSKRNSNNNWS